MERNDQVQAMFKSASEQDVQVSRSLRRRKGLPAFHRTEGKAPAMKIEGVRH